MRRNVEELTKALELDRDGDWDSAHTIVQGIESPDSYWIEAPCSPAKAGSPLRSDKLQGIFEM